MTEPFLILPDREASLRKEKVQEQLKIAGVDAALISDNANLLYLSGRVFTGFAYVPQEGETLWFIRRPVELHGANVFYIHRPEDIPGHFKELQPELPGKIGFELDTAPYSSVERLQKLFPESELKNISPAMRSARSVKTPYEQQLMRLSGLKHEAVYRRIPGLYRPGMTDHELQVEIERIARLEGCLGVFRISGQSMELFMGNILCGPNADTPTPYDFAMGGAGLDPSLPVGANGGEIRPGTTVMVDLNGNFTGYMTDMTRVFSAGEIPAEVIDAHNCSREICCMFERCARPGVHAKDLYGNAIEIVRQHGLERHFMGHRQHAGFIGHGLGIEINELPVIAPRSRDILAEGNMIALEPKFVMPPTGAVGIENTYLITPDGAVSLTNSPEEIIPLD